MFLNPGLIVVSVCGEVNCSPLRWAIDCNVGFAPCCVDLGANEQISEECSSVKLQRCAALWNRGWHTHTHREHVKALHSAWGLGACNFSHLGFFSFHRAKSAEKQDSEASIHSTALAVKALVAQLIEMFPEGCGDVISHRRTVVDSVRPLLHGFLWILIESCVAIPYLLTPLLRWEMLSRSIKYTLIKQYTSVAFWGVNAIRSINPNVSTFSKATM